MGGNIQALKSAPYSQNEELHLTLLHHALDGARVRDSWPSNYLTRAATCALNTEVLEYAST
jgi:hypothetical protein